MDLDLVEADVADRVGEHDRLAIHLDADITYTFEMRGQRLDGTPLDSQVVRLEDPGAEVAAGRVVHGVPQHGRKRMFQLGLAGFGITSVDYPTNGVQNGSPDGLALVDDLADHAEPEGFIGVDRAVLEEEAHGLLVTHGLHVHPRLGQVEKGQEVAAQKDRDALVAAGVYGNSYFANESLLYRVIALVVLAVIAALLAARTAKGKAFIQLGLEARTEIRKVVWPTGQETAHTTMIVVVPFGRSKQTRSESFSRSHVPDFSSLGFAASLSATGSRPARCAARPGAACPRTAADPLSA